MTPTPLEFWFELASTYSYPAAMRIESAARSAGIAVHWRPFLLGPLFQQQGYGESPFIQYPVKGRYMWRDVARVCARHGLPFRMPSSFPRTSVLGARIACAFQGEPWVPSFVRALYSANFAEDLDIGRDEVVARCLEQSGQAPEQWIDAVRTAPLKDRLRSQTGQAATLGLFGAPSFRVGDELFWGNDRLDDALAWARGDHPHCA